MTGRWTVGEWSLRLIAALGPVLAVLATAPAGVPPRLWVVAVVAGVSAAYARLPESALGTLAFAIVLLWWGAAFHGSPSLWAVPAAAALLGSHVAGVVLAYGPPGLGVDPATVRLWLRRAGVAFLLAPAVWLAAALLDGRAEAPGVWEVGLTVALAATVVAMLALGREADR